MFEEAHGEVRKLEKTNLKLRLFSISHWPVLNISCFCFQTDIRCGHSDDDLHHRRSVDDFTVLNNVLIKVMNCS